jgi:hypothetical protein
LACAVLGAGAGAPPAAAGDRVPWSAVELHGSRLGNSVTVAIDLKWLPAAGVEPGFLASPRGEPLRAASPQIGLLEVRTRIEPLALRPVTLASRVWFEPHGAVPLQRVRTRRGEADYDQTFRFTAEGVFRRQVEPRSAAEAAQPMDQWTKRDDAFYPFAGGAGISETSLLVVRLSAGDFATGGGPLELTVFNRRQLHRVALRPEAPRRMPAALTVRGPGAESRTLASVETVPVRLESRPVDPDAREQEEFSFLGLKDGIVFFLEKETRLPVQVNGALPGIGMVELRAREIRLAP